VLKLGEVGTGDKGKADKIQSPVEEKRKEVLKSPVNRTMIFIREKEKRPNHFSKKKRNSQRGSETPQTSREEGEES